MVQGAQKRVLQPRVKKKRGVVTHANPKVANAPADLAPVPAPEEINTSEDDASDETEQSKPKKSVKEKIPVRRKAKVLKTETLTWVLGAGKGKKK